MSNSTELHPNQPEPTSVGAFLLARIAEDEARNVASDCICSTRVWHNNPDCPKRIEAEVDAKGAIVEQHREMVSRAGGLHEAVRILAAVYADHPDYDETWRP